MKQQFVQTCRPQTCRLEVDKEVNVMLSCCRAKLLPAEGYVPYDTTFELGWNLFEEHGLRLLVFSYRANN